MVRNLQSLIIGTLQEVFLRSWTLGLAVGPGPRSRVFTLSGAETDAPVHVVNDFRKEYETFELCS